MTPPEEKAKELIDIFYNLESITKSDARQCALICVNEIIATTYMDVNKYWLQVKQVINN